MIKIENVKKKTLKIGHLERGKKKNRKKSRYIIISHTFIRNIDPFFQIKLSGFEGGGGLSAHPRDPGQVRRNSFEVYLHLWSHLPTLNMVALTITL